jgi:hypothetical protein
MEARLVVVPVYLRTVLSYPHHHHVHAVNNMEMTRRDLLVVHVDEAGFLSLTRAVGFRREGES